MKPNTAQQLLAGSGAFRELAGALQAGKRANVAYGMTGSLGSTLSAALQSRLGRGLLVIVGDLEQGQHWEADLSVWLPEDRVLLFPPLEVLPYEVIAHNTELLAERLGVMERLVFDTSEPYAVVAPVGALFRQLPPPAALREQSVELTWGDELDVDAFLLRLVSTGYERVDMVEARGHFSVRGGIIDVWPASRDLPVRVELFDVQVDSIREFSPDSQRSVQNLKRVRIGPARESILLPQDIGQGLARIQAELAQSGARLEAFDHRREAVRLREQVEEFVERVRENGYHDRLDAYLPYFYQELVTLNDYFRKPPLVVYSDPHRLAEAAEERRMEWADRHAELLSAGRLLPGQKDVYVDFDGLNHSLRAEQRVYLLSLLRSLDGVQPESVAGFEARQVPAYQGQWDLFMQEVEQHRTGAYKTVVVSSTRQRLERIREALEERRASHVHISPTAANLASGLPRGTCGLMQGGLRSGFVLAGARVAVLTDSGVYGRPRQPRRRFSRSDSRPVYDYEELRIGDYVVHVNHGIGKYMGLRNLEVEGTHRDYLYIKYEGEDRLYVPVDQVDKVQKYVGAEGREPRINSLETKEWSRVKHQVKKSVREMAGELLRLYAARESMEGHAYGPDTPWQADFEQAFPYEETPDQLRAVEEIKEDMRQPQPMDRLLCGDVGYGKTEVAMRAAFKAVMEGLQVAVLVPTTILTQQHFQTFTERFAGYPVRIRQLSRFRTQKEQEQVVTELRRGEADIVIGTHRLVQGDIAFKNLGLLIIDEEHRFGVAHKERLKQLRQSVDVLTLTATPIPRTLHMALAGLRDMSVIETPPQNRFPVETFVVEYNDGLIRDGILREMHRGGQIFYVHNRVQSIDYVYTRLTRLVPEARIAVAHGQMPERQLEQVMMDFLDRKYDVLLCTTIIESGLDIANANTLIVEQADKLGLAQLYQLRGRVGRSERVAYAYFTYQRKKVLTEVAEKRLQAIREFTQLGSGFKLALRDLEIRGAGNILGPEQHGFIISVGFDLYTQLLDEAVKELRGEAVVPEVAPSIELTVDAYIPDEYIREVRQKISMYKRLNATSTLEEVLDAEAELIDRYGDPPQPVQNLLALSRLRIRSGKVGILNVTERGRDLRLEFAGAAAGLVERARVPLEAAFGKRIRVKVRPKPSVTLRERVELGALPAARGPGDSATKLKKVEDILVTLDQLAERSKERQANAAEPNH